MEAALQVLVERVKPASGVVATHLDPAHVQCFVVERPEEAPQQRWRREAAREQLPAGVSLDPFLVRGRRLDASGSRSGSVRRVAYLLALVREEAVGARKELLQSVGLTPVVIGDLRTDLCFAYAFDPAFVEGEGPAVLFHEDRGWLLRHENGTVREAPRELHAGSEGRLEAAVLQLAEEEAADVGPSRLFVAGEGAENAVERAGTTLPLGGTPHAGPPQFRHEDGPTPAPEEPARAGGADAIPALAFGVRALYPDADPINFLTQEALRSARDQKDRREAVRLGRVVGGALAGLLLLVVGLNVYVEHRLAGAQSQLNRLDRRLAMVETARQKRNQLRTRVQKSQALVVQRTRTALLMDELGHAVPSDLWLNELTVARTDRDSAEVQVTGFAPQRADVATFLSRLETGPTIRGVQLRYSKVMPAETVYRRTDEYRRVLNRFAVQLVRSPRPHR
jgi:Tfp pilus assembly protein PilN